MSGDRWRVFTGIYLGFFSGVSVTSALWAMFFVFGG